MKRKQGLRLAKPTATIGRSPFSHLFMEAVSEAASESRNWPSFWRRLASSIFLDIGGNSKRRA